MFKKLLKPVFSGGEGGVACVQQMDEDGGEGVQRHMLRLYNKYNAPIQAQIKYEVISPKFIWAAPVYSCTHWLGPPNSLLPSHLGSSTRALLYWSAKIDDLSL
jgi:hypothetical protein